MSACRKIGGAAAGVLLAASWLAAQAVVLPPGGFVPGWVKAEAGRVFKRGELFNYIDGGAELFLEFGFDELLVQTYVKDELELTLEVYRLDSPESALGLYLLKSGRETPVPGVAARHTGDRFQLTILRGPLFIHVNNADGLPDAVPAMSVLARKVLSGIPEGRRVDLLDSLPRTGLVPGTERIFRGPYGLQAFYTFGPGDILLQNRKAFGLAADYRSAEGDIYSRILVRYPDIPAGRAALDNLRANLDSYLEVLKGHAAGFVFRDYRGRFGQVELKAEWLEILVDLMIAPDGPRP